MSASLEARSPDERCSRGQLGMLLAISLLACLITLTSSACSRGETQIAGEVEPADGGEVTRTATPPSVTATEWLAWNGAGEGVFVGRVGSGPVERERAEAPDLPWFSVYSGSALFGVPMRRGVDVYVTTGTVLTVGGEPSEAFVYDPEGIGPPFADLRVTYFVDSGHLIARSVDASPVVRRTGRPIEDVIRAVGEAYRSGPLPLGAGVVASETTEARDMARSHPDVFVYVRQDGLGFVRGAIAGQLMTGVGPGDGVVSELTVVRPGRVRGIAVEESIGILVDRRSMHVADGRTRSMMSVLEAGSPASNPWDATSGWLFVVRRVGDRLLLRVAIAE